MCVSFVLECRQGVVHVDHYYHYCCGIQVLEEQTAVQLVRLSFAKRPAPSAKFLLWIKLSYPLAQDDAISFAPQGKKRYRTTLTFIGSFQFSEQYEGPLHVVHGISSVRGEKEISFDLPLVYCCTFHGMEVRETFSEVHEYFQNCIKVRQTSVEFTFHNMEVRQTVIKK